MQDILKYIYISCRCRGMRLEVAEVLAQVGLIISSKYPKLKHHSSTSETLIVARDGYCTISDNPASYLRRRKICRQPEIAVIIPWRMFKEISPCFVHFRESIVFNHMRTIVSPSRRRLLPIPNAERRHRHNFRYPVMQKSKSRIEEKRQQSTDESM